ncbi:uncharacterized protein C9orf85 homolog [Ostrinia furnacalis]|uniref:uncharacterized protein C9orf85 homolog n=1 Tax=Ostrinia furnacalis TaxID=93504 RepID=UPI0010397D83|nr:uncharacterized protein C9orf85 homolog [Ostrinia furnacalis]XP_028162396.1 uncharacterized protein C9orf85 homolog [Ostrinia furnacalis]XP_028162397.1 uncharacterized protein C9orf85 homolog [Ostrinia furnacalis]XP_028162398.1 uncharacterized protein C9orf85 homolog [Ostrinia furnacalis]
MSTSRGNTTRQRPQKYQNKTAFKNDLHDTSHRTKIINSLDITGVCKRCKDIIEWKIKYKKYKPLTAPRKCVNCEQKTIKHAYHMLCSKCATEKQVCAKCCKPADSPDEEKVDESQNTAIQSMLKGLPERKRRTILRYLNKQGSDQQKTSIVHLEKMIQEMDKMALEDDLDDFFSDDDPISSDNEGKE